MSISLNKNLNFAVGNHLLCYVCLTVDSIDREHELRAMPSAEAARYAALRSTENLQIQSNKRDSSAGVSCLLAYLCCCI